RLVPRRTKPQRAGESRARAASPRSPRPCWARTCWQRASPSLLQRLQQGLDLGDVGRAQPVAFGEMGDERGHPAAEHAVDQLARFLRDIIGAGDGGTVEVAAPLLL